MNDILQEFSNAMWEKGHVNFQCKQCHAVYWLEGDKSTQIMLMRYGTGHVDDCETCIKTHDNWEKKGVFDV